MSVSELLYEAGILMFAGMVVVFSFLTLLIFATKMLSKFAAVDSPTDSEHKVEPSGQSINKSINAPDHIVAAISAAIKQFKKNQ